ncbi:MAG: hypothetical protein C0511_00935, partial [Hyphomicrobium sp.]
MLPRLLFRPWCHNDSDPPRPGRVPYRYAGRRQEDGPIDGETTVTDDRVQDKPARTLKVYPRIADIDAAAWDACANPAPAASNPFVTHAFLKALEDAGTTGEHAGWIPQHLILEDGHGGIAGAMPLY